MSSCTCPTGHPCAEARRLGKIASVTWRKLTDAEGEYICDLALRRAHRLAVQALHEHRWNAESFRTHTEDREG